MTQARLGTWLLWLALYAATTAVMYMVSGLPDIRVSHAVLVYLMLIMFASRHGGRALAMTIVALSYVAVDWLYVPPRFTFGSASDLDWIILLGFLASGWLLSEMFAKQREATRVAEERTREVERLSTERLQLEREASTARVMKEADRLKNALLSSLAHDLRSPVATLSLLADPAAGFGSEAALLRVGEEARRLGEYIATLQRFASEGGGSVLAVERHDALQLVQTALRSSEALIAGRLVRVEQNRADGAVWCDLTLTVQVIGNLVQNAVRYAPASEPIDVQIVVDETSVDIVVADRGPGVPEHELQRLFSPMQWRSDSRGQGEGQSARMGMGLAIARTFARAQRGDVHFRPRVGGGSEVLVRLPRAVDEVGGGGAAT